MKLVSIKLMIVLLFGLPLCGQSQNLTGIWRGYFITEAGEHYRLEFQVEQSKTKSVKGVSYSYLDTRFYGKASMMGNFALKNGSFTIQETRTTEVKNLGGGGTCLMNYKFTYARSGREEFLEGSYVGKTEDRQNPKNNGKWGDCGGGTVFLRRVTTSDFILEPFLKKPTAPPEKTTTAAPKKLTPAPKKNTVKPPKKTTPPVVKKTVPAKRNQEIVKRDSIPSERNIVRAPIEKTAERRTAFIPEVTRARKNDLVQTLTVSHEEITIKLYDNGEIDNDTVSLYVNGQLVLANKRLSTTPITYTMKIDENSPDQTIVMVAENMGRIPPNTSLMVVQDGETRHSVGITSTEQKNAMVRFRYQK